LNITSTHQKYTSIERISSTDHDSHLSFTPAFYALRALWYEAICALCALWYEAFCALRFGTRLSARCAL
jgi:hypothetical protein